MTIPMNQLEIQKFGREFKEANGRISIDNTVFVLEREYGITNAEDERPILMTAGILGYGNVGCIGILFYDPNSRVGTLVHLVQNHRFSQTVDEVLKHLSMHKGRRFFGYIIRPTENPEISDQIRETERILLENQTLIQPFEQIPVQTVVFDTRDGSFYQRPDDLYVPSIERRPYGNRVIRNGDLVYTNPSLLSCCYEPRIPISRRNVQDSKLILNSLGLKIERPFLNNDLSKIKVSYRKH